jgi:hypothetical protein
LLIVDRLSPFTNPPKRKRKQKDKKQYCSNPKSSVIIINCLDSDEIVQIISNNNESGIVQRLLWS